MNAKLFGSGKLDSISHQQPAILQQTGQAKRFEWFLENSVFTLYIALDSYFFNAVFFFPTPLPCSPSYIVLISSDFGVFKC